MDWWMIGLLDGWLDMLQSRINKIDFRKGMTSENINGKTGKILLTKPGEHVPAQLRHPGLALGLPLEIVEYHAFGKDLCLFSAHLRFLGDKPGKQMILEPEAPVVEIPIRFFLF